MKRLTDRECEIARLVAQDMTDKAIGDHLGISPHTVREHLDRITKKIRADKGKRSRRRVIARWIEAHDRRGTRKKRRVPNIGDATVVSPLI